MLGKFARLDPDKPLVVGALEVFVGLDATLLALTVTCPLLKPAKATICMDVVSSSTPIISVISSSFRSISNSLLSFSSSLYHHHKVIIFLQVSTDMPQ
jgi:hypothetical protein